MSEIVEKIIKGDVRAVARLIRDIDDRIPSAVKTLKELFPHTGRAFVVGITGAPGVGKSTLTDRLTLHLRNQDLTVGILAVDPTSPFSGGAILGDRIRMQRHGADDGVFIRSMATRGHFGGLTQSTKGAIMVLDAMGKDIILVETVGVGQDEVDIARSAHTTIIVLAPGLGDDIQAIKAGILEVGDIFVVNKADRADADRTVHDLLAMVELSEAGGVAKKEWKPPILKTAASNNQGVVQVWDAVLAHKEFLKKNHGEHYRSLDRLKHKVELMEMVKQRVAESVIKKLEDSGELDGYVDDLLSRRSDPFSISELILEQFFKQP
ncbi:MAG: methylmalonyl Co-A mutase-associated GTPase MeaB [Pseudomonadota bacterium]